VIGPSEYILGVHRDLFGGATEHIVRHPLELITGAPAKPSGTRRTLGYIGALTQIKGVGLLLAAAPSLAREGLVLRIAGEGPLRREVEAADHVHYEGWLPRHELGGFMGSCDVGLVPSLCNEASGRPYVVCEWLAAARPVLATRRGGLIEATRGGGVVTFDESPAGLVEAALRLRVDEEWRRVIATLPDVDDDADLRRWLAEHEAVYEAALRGVAAPAPA
jgi:glycosyltransferase involved in cell wall biosynthesis